MRTCPLREDVVEHTFLRLYDVHGIPAEGRDWFRYGRPVVGDLVELLAVDSADSSTFLRDEHLHTYGATRLREAGLANLLAAQPDLYEVLQGPGGLDVHVVTGESVYNAPSVLARFALTGWTEGVSPLSPHVHWWTEDDLVQVSSLTPAGDPVIHGDGAFGAVVSRSKPRCWSPPADEPGGSGPVRQASRPPPQSREWWSPTAVGRRRSWPGDRTRHATGASRNSPVTGLLSTTSTSSSGSR